MVPGRYGIPYYGRNSLEGVEVEVVRMTVGMRREVLMSNSLEGVEVMCQPTNASAFLSNQ